MAIEFTSDFRVGIEEIDAQHERLTAAINELHYAFMDGDQQDRLPEVVTGLRDYIEEHFGTEERLMAEHDYPERLEHEALHREFASRTLDFLLALAEDDVPEEKRSEKLTSEVLDFLVDWWTSHIKGTDRALGQYLAARGVS